MYGPETAAEKLTYSACIEAGARTEIIAALEGDIMRAGLVEQYNDIALGGKLYNSISASMRLLREQPDLELVSSTLPKNFSHNQLSGILFNLLNTSLERKSPEAYANPLTSKATDFENCCDEAESKFLHAIDGKNKQARQNALLVSRSGAPVLFQKSQHCETSLSFTDLSINGVVYPAGTIFSAKLKEKSLVSSDEMRVGFASDESVLAIGGLRVSCFKLQEQSERVELTRRLENPTPEVHLSMLELTKRLPSREILHSFMSAHGGDIE